MEMLSGNEHGVLILQGARVRLPRALGAIRGSSEGVLWGPQRLTKAEEYAEALVQRCAEALHAGAGELDQLSRGLSWGGRLRCAIGLVRDALPRRRPPLRLLCVCCPLEVEDEAEQERLVRAVTEHAPELPWFYGIRLVVHAPERMVVEARPPFVRVRSLIEEVPWPPQGERAGTEGGERWIL